MINLPVQIKNDVSVMSSVDLAKLCGVNHNHFMAKVVTVLQEGATNFRHSYLSLQNKNLPCYLLPERESCLLAMSYSYELQAKVYDSWKELSLPTQPKWMMQLSPEAKVVLEDLSSQLTQANEEVDRLQGVCNTITAQFAIGTTAPVFARQLNGVNVQKVNKCLVSMGWLLLTKRGLEPTAYTRDRYFKVVYVEFDKPNDEVGTKAKTTLTLAGAKWMYRAYLSNKLPMKKTWDGNHSHVEFVEQD